MVGRVGATKGIRSQSLGPVVPYMLKVFTGVIELKLLTCKDLPRLSKWALNAITSVLVREDKAM